MATKKKSLDNEVNLVAFISLLSVLICSLLLSAVWIQIGSMDVKQSVGGASQKNNKKMPMLWARMMGQGRVEIKLKDGPRVKRKLRRIVIPGVEGKPDFVALETHLVRVTKAVPSLKTVLIQPAKNSVYESIIGMMDKFKSQGLVDLGISPL